MKTIYLSLGSNLGDREANLRAALGLLVRADIRVRRVSPVYETEPVGCGRQRWFLNLAVEAETTLFPVQLLHRTARIERALGRVRTVPHGPRTIDIDILLYGSAVVRSTHLEIPHPRLHKRRFVLQPLYDLKPELRHPLLGRTMLELLEAAPPQALHRRQPGLP